MQKMPLRDKCCQTDHHHHGCCEPVHMLEPGDPPFLQQPLQTSKSGIQQIIECFRSGTKQLKHILLKDVNTIFECKLCRSLFRGLPNLITHKKFYCPPSLRMDDNSPDVNDKQSQAISDLLEAMYPRVDKQDYIIRLEPIEANRNAVFQYVSKADSPVENIEVNVTPDEAPVEMPEPSTEPTKAVAIPSEAETVDTPSPPPPPPPPPPPANKVIVTPEEPAPSSKPELECDDNSDSSHHLMCCLCKKQFHSRRSVRRHIRKVHKKKMEELKKFIELKKKPNQAPGRMRNRNILLTLGRSCPVCCKSFATKANVRRHFDEVHRGLRRDSITPDIATKPGQPLSLDTTSKKSLKAQKQKSSKAEYNLTTCKCLLCKRKYSSQVMLKRHMQIVHKITLSTKNPKRERKSNNTINTEVKVKTEPTESAESVPSIINSPPNEVKGTNNSNERKNSLAAERKNTGSAERKTVSSTEKKTERKGAASTERKSTASSERKSVASSERKSTPSAQKNKVKQSSENSKSSNQSVAGGPKKPRKPRLSAGFDFKKLYCKLCKRQFTSKQNLTKHIELHTDGSNIYVKFYRCPLCTYETRRKRDVIRHITVVHKKSSRYLGKITASLEIRAIKKPIDCVLNKVTKRGPRRDEGKQNGSKQDVTSNSPSKKYEGTEVGIEVKVTKNFSLHRCNKCGKAFAKKTFLEHHKKTHKANVSHSPEENTTTKGRSTRSKALVW
ncbi:zinc finger protein 800 isoform X1 [Hemicordylus capensis]|uniref:zinc finger protein 800 isoform X1 n=2 Tax=Hemicordylus capensis TaxID=884348 RepID=UPI002303A16B|nr:zinc finger protein 800 isoform X1 [Hemicordylus capensis]XP_053113003.1 zinc finger protein 800 isoform X1 [Hemicordylus capensis]XP_053113004.1 zinc finger protein 800 isoform X1 [Hemicordylus capensis]XP_053113005.1 zinc finger protein 800 isoform X1 [Hemicordylus capensis]